MSEKSNSCSSFLVFMAGQPVSVKFVFNHRCGVIECQANWR
nr:MAG TPA: hypothetical protein [Caudoviricetes sp.]DAS29080.1 MAG TPA: hypothetical protein [Caudoviricetes sp.]